MMEQTIFEYEGLKFTINYEFDAGEKQTMTDPGWPANVTVHSIWLNGVDMYDMLQPSIIEYIEHKLCCNHLDN